MDWRRGPSGPGSIGEMNRFCVLKYPTNDRVNRKVSLDKTVDVTIKSAIQLMSKALIENLVKLGGGVKRVRVAGDWSLGASIAGARFRREDVEKFLPDGDCADTSRSHPQQWSKARRIGVRGRVRG